MGSRINKAKEDDPSSEEEFERVFERFEDKSKAIIEDTSDVNLARKSQDYKDQCFPFSPEE